MLRIPNRVGMCLALALFVGLTAPLVAADVTQGSIKAISADQNQFVLRDPDNKEWTFQCKAECKIICPAKESKDKDAVPRETDTARLSDLKSGQTVTVLYDKQGERLTAVAILSNEGANRDAQLGMGTVKRVSEANEPLVMTDTDGKEWKFRVAEEAKVQISGKPDKINALKTGDQVLVVYEKKGEQFIVKEICSDRKPDRRERE